METCWTNELCYVYTYFNQDVKSKSYSVSFDKKQEVTYFVYMAERGGMSMRRNMYGGEKETSHVADQIDRWMNERGTHKSP